MDIIEPRKQTKQWNICGDFKREWTKTEQGEYHYLITRPVWLRDKHEDSIKLLFEIPVVFTNKYKGAKKIFIDSSRLPYYLNLHQSDIVELREAGLIEPDAPAKIPRIRVDYPALAQEYKRRIDSGEFSTRADLARSIGVSRAWITKVIQRGTHENRHSLL